MSLAARSPRVANSAVSWPPIDTTGTTGTFSCSASVIQPLRPAELDAVSSASSAGRSRSRRRGRRARARPSAKALRAFSCEAGQHAVAADAGERQPRGDVVGELVEAPLGPEARVELQREHERVDDHRPARVVADQQRGPVGDVLQPADLGAVVRLAERAQRRQRLADVLRIPGVGVVAGEVAGGEVGDVVQVRRGHREQRVERSRRLTGKAAQRVHVLTHPRSAARTNAQFSAGSAAIASCVRCGRLELRHVPAVAARGARRPGAPRGRGGRTRSGRAGPCGPRRTGSAPSRLGRRVQKPCSPCGSSR